MPTNILIVGAGAVGAFYASRLALASSSTASSSPDPVFVSVICRSNYAAVLASGFAISSPTYGSYTFHPAHVFSSPSAARAIQIPWDYIIVATKALPDISDDSAILAGLVGPSTSIVLIQNGLGVEAPYATRFPAATILSAVTIVSAAQVAPGHIVHSRWTRISVGPFLISDPAADSSRRAAAAATAATARFVHLLQSGGIADAEAYSHAKLQLLRWHKVAINAAMNPSSVLAGGATNNAMALDAELRIHLKGVIEEVLDTAEKVHGQRLPQEFATAEAILRSTAKNTSGSRPSMALDWEAGRMMELEVILGAPIRIARERGLEMPRLQSMYALIKMAQTNRDKRVEEKGKL